MTHRLIPSAPSTTVTTWSGTAAQTVYTAAAGSYLDVADNLVGQLVSGGFLQVGPPIGVFTTANRPTFVGAANAGAGSTIVDSTLNAVCLWDGETWRNPATGAAV